MNLSYSQLVRIFARGYNVPAAADGAFRARLRKLQGEGIPLNANPGKGRRVEYSLKMAMELMVAIELLHCGSSPAEAARIIQTNREKLFYAILLGTYGTFTLGDIVGLDPMMLVSTDVLAAPNTGYDDATWVSVQPRQNILQLLSKRPENGERWRWAVIDLSRAAQIMFKTIELEKVADLDEVINEVRALYVEHRAQVDEFAVQQARL